VSNKCVITEEKMTEW